MANSIVRICTEIVIYLCVGEKKVYIILICTQILTYMNIKIDVKIQNYWISVPQLLSKNTIMALPD